MSDALIASKLGSEAVAAEHYDVWPDCMDSVQVFLAMSRQWRTCISPSGHVLREGLDFSCLQAIAAAFGISDMRALVADLRIMEEAACAVFQERLERDLRK